MDRRLLHEQIDSFLETLREQHEHLKSQDMISAIEQDIMMDHIRKFYDCCRLLGKASGPMPKMEHKTSNPEVTETVISPRKEMQTETPKDSPKNTYKEPKIDLLPPEDESPVITSTQLEIPISGSGDKGPELKKEEGETPVILAEKFKEETSLYEKISQGKNDATLATKLQKKPVPDLKAAIGINEKFSYINHLFSGNALEYINAVDFLNKAESYDSAMNYLESEVMGKYQWKKENPLVGEFIDLVERRFL